MIRLLDAWNRFCRQLVLVSARGDVLTASGARLGRSPAVAPGQRPLDALKTTYPLRIQNRPVWEPRWFIPREAINAANALQIQNLRTVVTGLGLTQTLAGLNAGSPEDLRNCRNYLAHRSKLTFDGLDDLRLRLGLSPRFPADELPKSRLPGGATLFEVWCADLTIRGRTACQ